MSVGVWRPSLYGLNLCGSIAAWALLSGACLAQPQAVSPGAPAAPAQAAEATIVARPVTANVDVTDAMLLNAAKDQDNWLLNGRTYDNQRYSPLKQINPGNVGRLVPVAIVQTGVANSFEATPMAINGVMFVSTPGDHVLAYDAASGEPLWSYTPSLRFSDLCCGPQSRGVAVAYGKVFLAQLDGTLTALDARNGAVLWKSDYELRHPEAVAQVAQQPEMGLSEADHPWWHHRGPVGGVPGRSGGGCGSDDGGHPGQDKYRRRRIRDRAVHPA